MRVATSATGMIATLTVCVLLLGVGSEKLLLMMAVATSGSLTGSFTVMVYVSVVPAAWLLTSGKATLPLAAS
jgi:hypothetical protein